MSPAWFVILLFTIPALSWVIETGLTMWRAACEDDRQRETRSLRRRQLLRVHTVRPLTKRELEELNWINNVNDKGSER